MFTKDQLKQMQELLDPLKKGQEEIRVEVSALRSDVNGLKSDVDGLKSDVDELKSNVNNLNASVVNLTGRVDTLETEVAKQGKTLKYVKNKLNSVSKTVDIIAIRYDERLVDNTRRIIRLEDVTRIGSGSH